MPLSLNAARRVAVPAIAAAALTASLLATAAPALAGSPGSHPHELTTLGTRVLFVADDGSSGQELWQTNGTTTSLLKQIGPGAASGGPNDLAKVGSLVFFTANDGGGQALWRTNGTSAGTKKLPAAAPTTAVTAVGSRAYYAAQDPVAGYELFTSDGTAAGTKRLTDIRPGITDSVDPSSLTPLGTRVAFSAFGADPADDLWISGATAGSAKRVKDFGATASIDWIRNVAGTLYLQVQPTPGTFQLWKSDGTKAGTVKIKTLPNTAEEPTAAGSTLFFRMNTLATGRELWRSKGTAKTTNMVKEIYPGDTGAEPETFAAVGSRLYFVAYTPVTVSADDYEIWRSDGTKAGTVMLKNINPTGYSEPYLLQNVGGTLRFFADDGVHGREPWRSDGTKAGTVMVKDVAAGSVSSSPFSNGSMFAKLGTRVYFPANDGVHGDELWRTTSGGAALWANLLPD